MDESEIQLDTMVDIAPFDSMFCMQIRTTRPELHSGGGDSGKSRGRALEMAENRHEQR